MNDYWVDCITGKQVELLPEVKKFLIYLNKWCFDLHILDGRLEVEEQSVYFNQILLNTYNIHLCKPNLICEDCLVPVDIYYLPHCSSYFQKEHMLHYVIVKKVDNDVYHIFDDNPKYTGTLGKLILEQANAETFTLVKQQLPILLYDKSAYRKASLHKELCIYLEYIKCANQDITDFIQEIFKINDNDLRAVFVSDFAMISKKYMALVNAILHIYELIKLDSLSDYAAECLEYFQKWNVIFGLNTKWTIVKQERCLGKIKSLLPEIISLHTWMNQFILNSKDVIYDYIKRMGS